ncbi:MAG TPA: glutamate racemase [Holophagaceae bacterium]|nr:glutamate racemase [Holophagaceae bacterium]
MTKANQPIGVFDSGIGGLTVVHALRRLLPQESIVYLGDTARVPYGTKSHATIERYTLQAGAILGRYEPKLIVIACNTASAHGLPALQAAAPCPVVGVIEPGAEVAATVEGPVAVLSTLATLQSGAYEAAIRRRNPAAQVHSLACPLLVALAEEGWFDDAITEAVCHRYLDQLPPEVRTFVLGCTHYPALMPSLRKVRPAVRWIDSGEVTADAVEHLLASRIGFRTGGSKGPLRVLLTDTGSRLKEVGARFLGEPIPEAELVEL